jgi:threonylcarbamoyladenosine tRNA methylthiotransferase MtaB
VKVFLHTFGCRANQYDTEVVRQRLESMGCTVVSEGADAEAAVINSCTVTASGEAKLRSLVRRLARRSPAIRTVVMGCAAALDDGTIAKLPSVAGVVGGSDAESVARALLPGAGVADPGLLRGFASASRAWLKIQDGCDEHCTFCATTLARGTNRSRSCEELIAAASLLARRHAEIVLTGVHIGTYGADRRDGVTLGVLARRLVAALPDTRFRLSSIEATEVCDDLASLMADAPANLAPHLHAPLQSASDRVLKRMGRHWYTARSYRERLEWIAARTRVLGLGADLIVGFPGESEADHRATVDLVEALPFTYLHVFPYSERPGTSALRLGRPVGGGVARERGAELRELAARKAAAHRSARDGSRADLVFESRQGGWVEALTEDYVGVRAPADAPWVAGRTRSSATLRLEAGRLVAAAA